MIRLLPSHRLRDLLIAGTLLALTLAAYWPATQYGFSSLDDGGYVFANPLVTGGLTLDAFWKAFAAPHRGYWLPMTWLSYMVDVELGGLDPAVFHRTNLFLHAANTLLVFWLLRRATGACWSSAAAALLFSVHPLRVESVVWITERKDVLSTVFLLLSLAVYARHIRRPSLFRYTGCVALWVLAALAKPSAVVFPLLLPILDFWPLRRYPPGARPSFLHRFRDVRLPFALASGLAALTLYTQYLAGSFGDAGALTPFSGRPWWASVEQPPTAYVFYAAKFFWPVGLGIRGAPSQWATFDATGFALSASLLTLATVFAWKLRRDKPYFAAGWLWYLAALLPNSGLVGVGSQWLADRFTYLPHLGLVAALVWGTAEVARDRPLARRALWIPAFAGFATLFALTRLQVEHWRTDEALFTHSASLGPDDGYARLLLGRQRNNWIALLLLGRERITAGDLAGGSELFRQVTQGAPQWADGHYHLAMALAAQGHDNEALPCFLTATQLRPLDPGIHFNLAVALARTGHHTQAAEHFRQTLRLRPDDFRAAFDLGYALYRGGDPAGAADAFALARSLRPHSAAALYNLAASLETLGDQSAAATLRRESLRLRPDLLTASDEPELLARPASPSTATPVLPR